MTLISLTSIPPRFQVLRPTLDSLLQQGAHGVILALPRQYHRFGHAGTPPGLPEGVTLLWSDVDHGPATKVLAAAQTYPNSQIVYCDDDVVYQPGWLDALRQGHQPNQVSAATGWSVARLKRKGCPVGDADIVQGYSGVLVSAQMIDAPVFDMPAHAREVDDIWLSGHFARQGRHIRLVPAARALCQPRDLSHGLQTGNRAALNTACATTLYQRHGVWPPFAGPRD